MFVFQFYGNYDDSGNAYIPVKDELVAAYFDFDSSWNRAQVRIIYSGDLKLAFVLFVVEIKLSAKPHLGALVPKGNVQSKIKVFIQRAHDTKSIVFLTHNQFYTKKFLKKY